VAKYIRYFGRSTVRLFRARIQAQLGRKKSTDYRSAEADNHVEDLDAEDNLDDEGGSGESLDETETKLQNLERFVQDSDALLILKDTFRLFVHPNPVLKAMLEVW
jgi:hypothetical protein